MDTFLAVSPVVAIFLLMTWGRRTADVAGAAGWLYTALLAVYYFQTSWEIVLLASLAGVLSSFPVSLMVATSIFQVSVMEEAGAIRRVVVFMKSLGSEDRAVQVMLINVGIGTVLAALGATPVSILPPIMLALGYSDFVSVALPAIGYDALCTYALLGVPVVVFADVVKGITGQEFTPAQVGMYFARYMPVVTSLIALSMLWLVGGVREILRSWHVALLTGVTAGLIAIGMNLAGLPTLTGVVAGAGVVAAMLVYLRARGRRIFDRTQLSEADHRVEREMSLTVAILPWILLVLFSVLTNVDGFGLRSVLFERWSMPVEIVPGKPERLRMAWHAYTWVLIATLFALPVYRLSRAGRAAVWRKTLRRAPRPVFAAAIFFAIALVLNHSGKTVVPRAGGTAWALDPGGGMNMVKVVADACASLFGQAYAGVAAFLGLLGGFISGSEASSIAMLSKLHFETVGLVFPGIDPSRLLAISLLVAAASGIGGGLASVISPAKLQNAAAVIDRIGLEGRVIRSTAVLAILMVLVTAIVTLVFLALGTF
jgi:lactate permease